MPYGFYVLACKIITTFLIKDIVSEEHRVKLWPDVVVLFPVTQVEHKSQQYVAHDHGVFTRRSTDVEHLLTQADIFFFLI